MKVYRIYLLFMLLGFLAPAFIWAGLVQFQLSGPTESSRWPYELYQIKTPIAQTISSPKVIVVSGSSSLFNISAEAITQDTGMSTVNMGTYAGLGLNYLLMKARNVATSGDTILLTLEYAYYAEKAIPNESFVDYVFARDPAYLRSLSLFEQIHYTFAMSPQRLLTGLKAKVRPPEPKPRSDGYEAKTINSYGDETINQEARMDDGLRRKVADTTPVFLLQDGITPETIAWQELARFVQWCNDHDVTLLASFPATIYFPEYDEPLAQAAIEQITAFYSSHDVPILGSAYDFMYDRSLFYDTVYHLHDRGRLFNTERIVTLLEPYLEPHEQAGVR